MQLNLYFIVWYDNSVFPDALGLKHLPPPSSSPTWTWGGVARIHGGQPSDWTGGIYWPNMGHMLQTSGYKWLTPAWWGEAAFMWWAMDQKRIVISIPSCSKQDRRYGGPWWHLKVVHIWKLRTSVKAFKDERDSRIIQKSQGPMDIFRPRVVEEYFESDSVATMGMVSTSSGARGYLFQILRMSKGSWISQDWAWRRDIGRLTENDCQILQAQEYLLNATNTAKCLPSQVWAESESRRSRAICHSVLLHISNLSMAFSGSNMWMASGFRGG